jgi:hypothetical protein
MSTYTPIATQTLGSAASSVIFSSIPQGYTDLVIVLSALTSVDVVYSRMKFNFDSGANYSSTYLEGDGSVANSNRYSNNNYIQFSYWNAGAGANPETTILNIMNYSNSTTNKTALLRYNGVGGGASGVTSTVGLWRNTNAINAVEFSVGSGTFDSGSTFSLYGIAVGNSSAKADGGSSVTTDGTYYYHTFKSSGAFIPRQAITVDYLVVAGGGGGGGSYSGGGGAGGLRSTVTATGGGGTLETALSLDLNTNYTVTVGAGGSGGIGDNAGSDGSNSVFSTITSTGGGGGGYINTNSGAGRTGGSGGGAAGAGAGSAPTGGSRTANQGYAGGNGFVQAAVGPAGGGGGAGAVGSNGASSTAGNGGAGVASSISGSSVTYAGGGGGGIITGTAGTGGSGGGGNGSSTTNGTAGTVNLGGGGGGADNNFNGGAGGSGIVIIRYAV